MCTLFYKSVLEDEMKVFGIKKESLKVAAKSVANTYSRNALTNGKTFLDYNIPSNRCAYLYKYASIHSNLVTKYFRKLIKKKEVKSSLHKKKTVKICCLGGGPGTDIVGLFKALAVIPYYHQKVVEVTVLDICGGWRNSFKRIISGLISGKVKDVPETFVNASDFKFKLVEVNLLEKLPSNVASILSDADIVCMVKFVSAIIGYSSSVEALKVIGEKFKMDAIVLFIDNYQGNVFKPLADISGQIGLQIVLGPLHESFGIKTGYIKRPVSSLEKELFGCLPLGNTRVTVLGFIKSDAVCVSDFSNNISCNLVQGIVDNKNDDSDDDDDDSWDTNESESVTLHGKNTLKLFEKVPKFLHKFTQTNDYTDHEHKSSIQTNELNSVVDSLCDLVNVLSEWFQQKRIQSNCDNL